MSERIAELTEACRQKQEQLDSSRAHVQELQKIIDGRARSRMVAVLNAKGEICGIDADPELAWFQARSFYHMNEQGLRERGFRECAVDVSFVCAPEARAEAQPTAGSNGDHNEGATSDERP